MARIERFLPIRLAKIEEFTQFCLAQDPEFDECRELREKWIRNKTPWEADLDGITAWEKVLGIRPSINATLQQRRVMVVAKLNERLPYTYIQLHRMMAAICGRDGFDLKLKDFVLMAVIAMEEPGRLAAVKDMLQDVLPAHIFILLVEFLEGEENLGLYSHGLTRRLVSTHAARVTQDVNLACAGRARRIVSTHTPNWPRDVILASAGVTRRVVVTHTPKRLTMTRLAGTGRVRRVVVTYSPEQKQIIYPAGWGRLVKRVSTGGR